MSSYKFINCAPYAVSVLGWHGSARKGVRVGAGEEAMVRSDMAGWSIDTWSKTSSVEHKEWMERFEWSATPSSIAEFFPATWADSPSTVCCKEVKIDIEVEQKKWDGVMTDLNDTMTYTLRLTDEPMVKPAARVSPE
jgi:hypothetical protein